MLPSHAHRATKSRNIQPLPEESASLKFLDLISSMSSIHFGRNRQTNIRKQHCMYAPYYYLSHFTLTSIKSYFTIHCKQLPVTSDYGKSGPCSDTCLESDPGCFSMLFLQGAKPRLARVSVTFKRRGSPTKPTLPVALARTVLTMITSSIASTRWSGATGYCKSRNCGIESVRLTKRLLQQKPERFGSVISH